MYIIWLLLSEWILRSHTLLTASKRGLSCTSICITLKYKLIFQLINITVYLEFSPGEKLLSCVNDCVVDMMTFSALAKFKVSAVQRSSKRTSIQQKFSYYIRYNTILISEYNIILTVCYSYIKFQLLLSLKLKPHLYTLYPISVITGISVYQLTDGST